jgi:hypothetical protein
MSAQDRAAAGSSPAIPSTGAAQAFNQSIIKDITHQKLKAESSRANLRPDNTDPNLIIHQSSSTGNRELSGKLPSSKAISIGQPVTQPQTYS